MSMSFENAIDSKVGTVTAVSLPSEFQFQINLVSKTQLIIQDFVVVEHPTEPGVPLLAKIVSISRFNPLLPEEATLELAQLNIEPELSPLPVFGSMEMVGILCKIIGFIDKFGKMKSPGFPVKPGNSVYLPNSEYMKLVLSGENESDDLSIGCLRNRSTIPVSVNGNEILNKHLAVLAMTGAGKTYAVGVLIEELMKKGYPILVIDPHSDYVNMGKDSAGKEFRFRTVMGKRGSYKFREFQSGINFSLLSKNEFVDFVISVSEEDVSPAQQDVWKRAYDSLIRAKKGLNSLYSYLNEERTKKDNATISACFRQLNSLRTLLEGTDASLDVNELREYFGLGKGVLLNMSGLPYQLQRTTVQIVLQRIFEYRKRYVLTRNKKYRIPPVFIVVEEAHNYAPATIEGESFPSRLILRRIATEGRKFGFSMCIVSQRPARLDSTVLSQCNSQLILKVVNPNDQNYIRASVESLAQSDLLALPDLAQGEALLSGAWTPIPSVIQIRRRESKEGIAAVDRLKEIAKL